MALVSKDNPGEGILVDARGGRPVGDTNSSAVFLTDLPKNFHGGDEALHFALGELFGQYGKIKKIELYMEKGILETEDFKGEALVVYHPGKKTGTRDKGDPVWEACTDMDGKWRMLGKRGWYMHCEAAKWQKEGFDVKTKPKVFPCVEISNLWEYDPSRPMMWFAEMQEAIRVHAAEHVQNPFVKVEPSAGSASIWVKGATDAMKLAGMMHKSFFMGRKIVASLCRKEKPLAAENVKAPTGELSMKLPQNVWDGSGAVPGTVATDVPMAASWDAADAGAEAAEPVAEGPQLPPGMAPAEAPSAEPVALLKRGRKALLKDLVSKPENNGRQVEVIEFLPELGKYQVVLDGRTVKIKPENLDALPEEPVAPKKKKKAAAVVEEVEDDADVAEAEAAAAEASEKLAAGDIRAVPEDMHDPKRDGFLPTVCVDPSLLPQREEAKEVDKEAEAQQRRDRSRSRARRQEERIAAMRARLDADKGPRPAWVMQSPEEMMAKLAGAAGGTGGGALPKEPEQSREELMKLSVGKLKELLKEFGKNARGCLEKRDFVDRLKPAPKP